jgi:hypothetical protein
MTGIVSPDAVCKTYGRLGFLSGIPQRCLAWRWLRTPRYRWSLGTVSPVSSHRQSGCPRSTGPVNLLWNEGVRGMVPAALSSCRLLVVSRSLVPSLTQPLSAVP